MSGVVEVFLASLLFGLSNGLHCAGMCGPLALLLGGKGKGIVTYHAGRLLAYCVVGFLMGSLGEIFLPEGLGRSVAWVLIALSICLVLLALGIEHSLRMPFLGKPLTKIMPKFQQSSPFVRSFGVGACSPLLPCGLSMTVYGTAVVSGDALLGTTTLAGFALGSVPLLLLAQVHMEWLKRTFGPKGLLFVTRATMLLAAGLLFWRGLQTLQDASCCSS